MNPKRIKTAYAPYYDSTESLETPDTYRLDELKHELDGTLAGC